MAVAQERVTEYERLNDLVLARLINKAHFAPVISAMEVSQLDDSWIDLFVGVMTELPSMQARQKHINDLFKNFEKQHPTYGKFAN